jgi:hypothetical protein
MTDAPEKEPHKTGVTAALANLGSSLISVLPPAFLLLIVLNIIFLGMVTWMFDRNAMVRNELLTKIVEKCLLVQRQ